MEQTSAVLLNPLQDISLVTGDEIINVEFFANYRKDRKQFFRPTNDFLFIMFWMPPQYFYLINTWETQVENFNYFFVSQIQQKIMI